MSEKGNQRAEKLRVLTECAIMVAIAFVLSYIKVWKAPYGGSVTLFSMAPVILVSYRHGVKWGAATGFVYSVLQLVAGLGDVAYVPDALGITLCVLLDYILAFTVIGFAGMFRSLRLCGSDGANELATSMAGAAVVVAARYLCHLVSGAVVWYSLTKGWYADDATHIVNRFGMWGYSALYNMSFMLPELILTLAAIPVLLKILRAAKL